MAKLSPETKTILNAMMENLLEVIDEAKRAEFLIQDEFGETAQTLSVLDELAEIAQQAQGLYSQISTLRLRVAEAQPILLPDMLNLLEQRIITTTKSDSCSRTEFKRNQARLEAIMTHAKEMPTTEQVQKTLANSRRRRRELEIVSLQLQDLILQLESSNLHQKQKLEENKLK